MSIPNDARPTPIRPVKSKVALTDPKTGLPSIEALAQQEGLRTYVNGAGRIVPCSASTTDNVITLTPNDASPLLEKYVFGDVFVFWADADTTDLVTVTVVPKTGTLATLKAYAAAVGAQAGSGSIAGGGLYLAFYMPTLDSEAGGFVVLGAQTSGTALLASGTVASQATLDIYLSPYAGYRNLTLVLSDLLPATDSVNLWMRFSTDGGATFLAAGYNYAISVVSAAGSGSSTSGSAAQIIMALNVGSLTTEGYQGTITMLGRASQARWSRMYQQGYFINATPDGVAVTGGGAQETAQDTDAIRLMFSSGNIAAGSWSLHGVL